MDVVLGGTIDKTLFYVIVGLGQIIWIDWNIQSIFAITA
jgi:hypothetical protein